MANITSSSLELCEQGAARSCNNLECSLWCKSGPSLTFSSRLVKSCLNPSAPAPIFSAMCAPIFFLGKSFLILFDFLDSLHLDLFEETSESCESLQCHPPGSLGISEVGWGTCPRHINKAPHHEVSGGANRIFMPARSLTFHNCLWLFYYSRTFWSNCGDQMQVWSHEGCPETLQNHGQASKLRVSLSWSSFSSGMLPRLNNDLSLQWSYMVKSGRTWHGYLIFLPSMLSQGEFWLSIMFGIWPLLQKLSLVSSVVWAVIIW